VSLRCPTGKAAHADLAFPRDFQTRTPALTNGTLRFDAEINDTACFIVARLRNEGYDEAWNPMYCFSGGDGYYSPEMLEIKQIA
jgi:hypothetical protein